ncbi:MAG: uracil-DNA glycosylase [Siculibacillus sp.]
MPPRAASTPLDPARDCPTCPRLVAFRHEWQGREPTWFNGPVPSFVGTSPRLLIVGLAPGVRGANRTGRPFTGDYAGDLLYETLADYGFSNGTFRADPNDGLTLTGALITNAVRCVPPENKPTPSEIHACRPYLVATLAAYPTLTDVLALGRVAHETFLRTVGAKLTAHPFAHGAIHRLANGLRLHDSYHCSRYNTNTGRLTREMFRDVFDGIRDAVG